MGERMALTTIASSLSSIGTNCIAAFTPQTLAARAPAGFPDWLSQFLFEDQWYVWAALLIGAVAIRFLGRFQNKPKIALIGWVLVVVAALHMSMANRVDTPSERLFAVQRSLVAAANKQDTALIVAHFHPGFQAPQLGIHKFDMAAGEIDSRLKAFGIQDTTINRAALVQQSGTIALADVVVTTRTAVGPVKTSWILHWEDLPESDWRIRLAELTAINDQPWNNQNLPRN